MDHAEARELLELAAAESGGFDRLMAGDTADAAALAGHLAGCPDCADEMLRLRRASGVIRSVVRSSPPPELRARTLAYVAALGRPRGDAAEAPPIPATAAATLPAPAPAAPTSPIARAVPAGGRRSRLGWVAAIAAGLAIAIGGTALLVGRGQEQRIAALEGQLAELRAQDETIAALERVTAYTVRVSGTPDAATVDLDGTGSDAWGTLLFSPSTTDLVVLANGLPEPAAGREFRCWVEVDGKREAVGRMFFANELAFWIGEVDAVKDLPAGSRFGVTLVDDDGSSLDGDPVLSGAL
jgi:Anti-sigma-K factor rskA